MHTARRPSHGSRRRRSGSPLFAQLLTAAVESAATEVAILFNPTGDPAHQREITYQELDEGSSRLARELIERGIGPGDVVAIGLARSPESVLAIWAIAKTGAAHVPIDPGLPGDRIDRIAAGSGAALGLTTSRYRTALGRSLYWMELDDPVQAERISRRARHPISYADRVRMLDARHPAYIAYTSGPGGEHTGVIVPHSGLAPVVTAAADRYGITSDSRVAHMCSPDVDLSVLELLLTFTSGATLVLVPAGTPDGRHLTGLLAREQVTHVLTTPAALAAVDPAELTDLQVVTAIGGAGDFDPIGRWAHERNFFTGYGRIEAGVLATGPGTTAPGAPITVGTALTGSGLFVLDTRLRPVPVGVAGELYLAGPALAHGYLERRALTAQRFVAAPFGAEIGHPGARMYRTGDLVRRIVTPRGEEIEYLGRIGSRVVGRGEVPRSDGGLGPGVLPERSYGFDGEAAAPTPRGGAERGTPAANGSGPGPLPEPGHGGLRESGRAAASPGDAPPSGREGGRGVLPQRRREALPVAPARQPDQGVLPGYSREVGAGSVPGVSAGEAEHVVLAQRSRGLGGAEPAGASAGEVDRPVLPGYPRGLGIGSVPGASAGEAEHVVLPQRSRGLGGAETAGATADEIERAVLPTRSRGPVGEALPVRGRESDGGGLPRTSPGFESNDSASVPGRETGRGGLRGSGHGVGVPPVPGREFGGGGMPGTSLEFGGGGVPPVSGREFGGEGSPGTSRELGAAGAPSVSGRELGRGRPPGAGHGVGGGVLPVSGGRPGGGGSPGASVELGAAGAPSVSGRELGRGRPPGAGHGVGGGVLPVSGGRPGEGGSPEASVELGGGGVLPVSGGESTGGGLPGTSAEVGGDGVLPVSGGEPGRVGLPGTSAELGGSGAQPVSGRGFGLAGFPEAVPAPGPGEMPPARGFGPGALPRNGSEPGHGEIPQRGDGAPARSALPRRSRGFGEEAAASSVAGEAVRDARPGYRRADRQGESPVPSTRRAAPGAPPEDRRDLREEAIVPVPAEQPGHRARRGYAPGFGRPETPAIPADGIGAVPPTPILAEYLAGGVHSGFAQTAVLALPKGIDRAWTAAVLGAVVERHDMLRARLVAEDGQFRWEVPDSGPIGESWLSAEVEVPAGTRPAEVAAIAGSTMQTTVARLDPLGGRMVAATRLCRPGARDALLLAVHRYVIDSVSWRILLADLALAWSHVAVRRRPELPAVPASFRRWAQVAAESVAPRDTELAHWREVLATPDPLLGDRAVDTTVDTHASVHRFAVEVPADTAEVVLTEVPALYRTNPEAPLLAALALAVRNWRSRRGVDCATTRVRLHGDGRVESVLPAADLTRTVGWFDTAYPVALDLSDIDPRAALAAGPVTAALLRAVKEQLVTRPRPLGFGLLRRSGAGEFDGPVAQIGFAWMGRFAAGVPSGDDQAWRPIGELGGFRTAFDRDMPAETVIDIEAVAGGDGRITASFAYAVDIVDEPAVRELADEWLAAVNAIARHTADPAAGGPTPSDLPLVRVGQPELDTWRAEYPGLVDVLPLAPLGAGLFFRSHLTLDGPDDYVMLFAVELGGVIDLDRLHRAAQGLVDRHPVLRTAFVTAADGSPVQLVSEAVTVPWLVADGVGDYEIPELLENERLTRFALDTAPLLRATVYRTVSGRTHLVLAAHQLLFDGRSAPILLADLLTLYARHGDPAALPQPPAYREHLGWLARQDTAAGRARWAEALRGARPTALAPVLAPPTQPETGIGKVDLALGDAETAAMAAYAAAAGVTVETVVQALWALLLAGLTGRRDIVFGAVVSGRPAGPSAADRTAGLFANTLPMRVRFEPGWTVRELLTRIRSEQDALRDHHHLSAAETAPGAAGLFDTLLAYDPYPVGAARLPGAGGGLDGLEVLELTSHVHTHYPVTLVAESADRLLLRLWYRRELIAESAAGALSVLLHALVGQLLAVPAELGPTPAADWWRPPGVLVGRAELPADRPRPATPSGRCGQVTRELSIDLLDALNDIATHQETTAFTVIQAALAILLARLSGHRDIAVGAFSTRQAGAGLSVLHTDLDPALRFDELLGTARIAGGALFETGGRGTERLGQLIDTVRTAAGQPPFRVLLATTDAPARLPEMLDLRVDLLDTGAEARLTFTYSSDLFDAPTLGDHADRLVRILHAVAADPYRIVGDIDLLAPGERDLVLREWNSGGVRVPAVTLVDLIEAQARLRPRSPAVRCGGAVLSFAELLSRSYQVARALIAAGAGPETLVAVAVPRTEDLPVALLGVLLSGAGYLPIDPTGPREQAESVLSDFYPVAVLTTAAERDAIPAVHAPVILLADTVNRSTEPVTDADRRAPLRPDNLAYVVHTSGSTGVPRAVAAAHRNVVELFANTQLLFEFDDTDVWTLFHSIGFDFSVWELWCALASGGSVVVVDGPTASSPEEFRELLVRERVTVLNQTPSAFYRLAEADRLAHTARALALRYVVFGGEALDLRRLRSWYERHGGPETDGPWLVNMYGLTETTVHVSFLALDEKLVDNPAGVIGRALPGLDAFVLDERLHPAPVGVPGEIYVSGRQLTRGYPNSPGLTATRFVADPFGAPGSRMYRSGDIGRWAAFGGRADLEYAGRADAQVQLRGFRIELGEVESALLRCPGVGRAVALVRTDAVAGERLLGYAVPAAEQEVVLDPVLLREQVAEFLPEYMVPEALVVVEELPLTAHGKLDRDALPVPAVAGRAPYTAPAGRVETVVAEVFADLLGVEDVGAEDDFFVLGGNSLTATRAVARINKALSAELAVHELFEAPTVAALAARVVPAVLPPVERPVLARVDRPERIPLAPRQYRWWPGDRLAPDSAAHNIPLAIGLNGALDTSALRYALSDVLERHEVLRTRYPGGPDGVPYQEILPVAQALRGGLESEDTADALGRISELLAAGFDVTTQVPVRGLLLTTGPDRHVLALVVHRIAADPASLAPLARDLMTAYLARVGGESPRWSPLSVQYADYAIWQGAVLGAGADENSVAAAQSGYWRDRLRGVPAEPGLPLDRPRPAMPSLRGGTTGFAVPAEVHEGLDRLARDRGATLFMVLHAAVTVLLHQLTGAEDIAVGTPVAGRGERALGDLVGMFANILALRSRVDTARPFAELLDETRDADLSAFDHAEIPFEQVVEVVAPDQVTARSPLVSVLLAVGDGEQLALKLPGLSVWSLDCRELTATFDLRVDIDPGRDADGAPAELHTVLTYPTDLFDEETVRSFGHRLRRILTAVAADPSVAVGDIGRSEAPERPRALSPAEQSVPAATAGTALAQTLSASVEDDPDGPAVVCGETVVSYQELDARSSRLARVLIARGYGPGTGLVSALERGVDAVVATWAVLKAGATLVAADAVEVATAADLVVAAGLAVGGAPAAPDLEWLLLDDPVLAAEIAAESPRPVTYAHRARPLRGSDPVVVDGTGRQVSYDQLATAVNRVHTRTGLTYEARTYRAGRGDSASAVLETVAAGAAGASVVLLPAARPDATPAGEWITHLWSDGAGLAVLDPGALEDLTTLVLDEQEEPGRAWSGIGTVLDLPTLLS
ncbi:amino acid adenylation domain-containing protein [Nocardia sp. NPDC004568]|uniref:amino acid adenylation domain-containing protein n=1 Tax=Nocardia sp. NPDC004568 TaxID=3154551 RepID=UPI0033A3DB83